MLAPLFTRLFKPSSVVERDEQTTAISPGSSDTISPFCLTVFFSGLFRWSSRRTLCYPAGENSQPESRAGAWPFCMNGAHRRQSASRCDSRAARRSSIVFFSCDTLLVEVFFMFGDPCNRNGAVSRLFRGKLLGWLTRHLLVIFSTSGEKCPLFC